MISIRNLLLGGAEFAEHEEYIQFKFRFMYALLLFGAATSALFIISDASGGNPLAHGYLTAAKLHLGLNLALAAVLYGRKHLFYPVAWLGLANSFQVILSAMLTVHGDELRVIWFFLNLPAVYLVLGRRAGVAATVISSACIIIGNRYLETPYSTNALVTSVVGFAYISTFFYVYSSRSISYFERMLESNSKLRYMASHDPLSGLLNARTYYEICDQMIRLSIRDTLPFSVLFIDLDHFKRINDQYGHDVGDHVLKSVADCLSENCRESDVLGRIGGEEFSVFLPRTDRHGALQVAEKLRICIEGIMPVAGSSRLQVTASIGVAENRPEHQTIASIQCQADQAMYLAKKQGRNRVSCID